MRDVTSAFTAGLCGFGIVGGITYFSEKPVVGMILASLPVALLSVIFEDVSVSRLFVPYFLGATWLLFLYSCIYWVLNFYMEPPRAAAVLCFVSTLASLFLWQQAP